MAIEQYQIFSDSERAVTPWGQMQGRPVTPYHGPKGMVTDGSLSDLATENAPGKIRITIHQEICVRKKDLPKEMIAALNARLMFNNPRYLKNLRFGRKEAGITPKLFCIREEGGNFLIARGFAADLVKMLHQFRVAFEIFITATEGPKVSFRFIGTLYEHQKQAFDEIANRRYGVLSGPDSSGKMVLALYLIKERQLPALVIVKRKDRIYQWRDVICRFLGLSHAEVGLIGDGHNDLGQNITVAIDRSLYRHIDELKDRIGFVIIDQCDIANLKIFFQAVTPFSPRYVLGLARAGRRPDGLTDLMHAYLGPQLFAFGTRKGLCDPETAGRIFHIRQTAFQFDYQENYADMISALCADGPRNEIIVEDILYSAARRNSRILVISERIDHLEQLREMLAAAYLPSVAIITGTTGNKKREEIAAGFNRGKIRVLMTTLKSVDALDCKGFNALFIASPVKAGDPLTQAIGRLLPGSERQPSVIYDYRDAPNILKASLKGRMKTYRVLGFVFQETPQAASADFVQ